MKDAPQLVSLRLKLDCNFASVRIGARQIRSFLKTHRLPDRDVWACELAFVEGCNNAVQHTPAALQHSGIVVELLLERRRIELRINDYSTGCDFPDDAPLPTPENERGRGIFLMRTLMDDVT